MGDLSLYGQSLEQSPALKARFRELNGDPNIFSIREELAVMKLIASQVLSAMARHFAVKSFLPPDATATYIALTRDIAELGLIGAKIEQAMGGYVGSPGPAASSQEVAGMLHLLHTSLISELRKTGNVAAIPVIQTELAKRGLEATPDHQTRKDFEVMFKTIRQDADGVVRFSEPDEEASLRLKIAEAEAKKAEKQQAKELELHAITPPAIPVNGNGNGKH